MTLFSDQISAIELLRNMPQTNISEWKTPKGWRLKDLHKGYLCDWKRSVKSMPQKKSFNQDMDELCDKFERIKLNAI